MSIPLRWAAGDHCAFKGTRWRVLYITSDRTVALIVRGPDAIIVDIASLELALS